VAIRNNIKIAWIDKEHVVAMAAPTIPKGGMSIKFRIIFILAEIAVTPRFKPGRPMAGILAPTERVVAPAIIVPISNICKGKTE